MKARVSVDLVLGHSHTSLVAAVFTSVSSTSDSLQLFIFYYSACVFGPAETCWLALIPLRGIDLVRVRG